MRSNTTKIIFPANLPTYSNWQRDLAKNQDSKSSNLFVGTKTKRGYDMKIKYIKINFVTIFLFIGLATAAAIGVTEYLTDGFHNLPPWM